MSLGSGFAVFLNHCKYRHESAGLNNSSLAPAGDLQHGQFDSRLRNERSPSRDVDQVCDARDDVRGPSGIQPRRPSSVSSEASH